MPGVLPPMVPTKLAARSGVDTHVVHCRRVVGLWQAPVAWPASRDTQLRSGGQREFQQHPHREARQRASLKLQRTFVDDAYAACRQLNFVHSCCHRRSIR